MADIEELTKMLVKFRDDRNWSQFHDSKNLALALSIECSELNELYLWSKTAEQEEAVDKERLSEELADVLAYALLLAERNNLDVATIVKEKIVKNGRKYPVEKVRGSSKKYNQY